jgi:hypothetical protein
MSDPRDDRELAEHTSTVLHGLRLAVRERVPVPPAAQLRRRAQRSERMRYPGVVAAAVVALVVLVAAWQLARPHTGAGPGPSRPAPSVVPTTRIIDDSITRMNLDNVTVDLEPNPDVPSCPSGPVRIVGNFGEAGGRKIQTFPSPQAYGDLTGDGRVDAIEGGSCHPPGAAQTAQMLVLAPRADGTLAGHWAGAVHPLGESIMTFGPYIMAWVTDGILYADYRPGTPGPNFVLGQVHAYGWTGSRFVELRQTRYPALLPTRTAAAPPVRLGPLAGTLGCPAGTVRFNASGVATLGGARYDTIEPPRSYGYTKPDATQLYELQWVPLGARRLLLARINCTAKDGANAAGVAVLEPDGTGLTVIDAVPVDGGAGARWELQRSGDMVFIEPTARGAHPAWPAWRWDGTHFKRIT